MISMARQYANCVVIGASAEELIEIWGPISRGFGTVKTQITAFDDGSWFIDAKHDGKQFVAAADNDHHLISLIQDATRLSPVIGWNISEELKKEFRRLDPAAFRRTVKCCG